MRTSSAASDPTSSDPKITSGRSTVSRASPPAVPDGVRDVVRNRLAQLPAGAQPLLSTAAVSGDAFDLEIVEAASGLDADAAADAADAALRSGLVVEAVTSSCRR